MNAVIRNLGLVILFGFGLAACGESDSDTASAPVESVAAPVTGSMPTTANGGEGFSMDNIEKAEGVIYQDEIYANWPYN